MVKLLNNAVAATNAATVGQALLVAARAGIDLDAPIEVMRAGSGGSAVLDLKAGPMRGHNHATLFKLDHVLKERAALPGRGPGGRRAVPVGGADTRNPECGWRARVWRARLRGPHRDAGGRGRYAAVGALSGGCKK
jgi:NAD-binding of NADP-dependent 3-hydroxyisobutyrate dehydrogenase